MNNYSLTYMFKVALKYWIPIVLAGVLTAVAFFSYFNFIAAPKYSAKGSIVVTNGEIISDAANTTNRGKVENSDILASLNFADTVTDVLKTSEIYKKLAVKTGNKYSFDELMRRTNVSRRSDTTLFVDITFVAGDPKEAVTVLNEYLELAPEYINSMVKNASSSIVPADKAVWDYPSDILLIGIGGICGAVIAYLIVFFIYSSSNVIRDEDSFREHCNINIIGVVPDFSESKAHEKKYSAYYGAGGKRNG